MDFDPTYSVVVRDIPFALSKSQIQTDSPNYFTTCFLGEFREAQTRFLHLSRDPDLFRIIVDHLCGYTVLPLNECRLPIYMSPTEALTNLRADAAFFQLDSLILACDALLSQSQRVRRHQYIALVGESPQTFANEGLTFNLECFSYSTTFISPEQLSNGPFSMLTRVDSPGFPETLVEVRTMGVLGGILARELGPNYHDEWQLLGWHCHVEHDDDDHDDVPRLLIVVERISVVPSRV